MGEVIPEGMAAAGVCEAGVRDRAVAASGEETAHSPDGRAEEGTGRGEVRDPPGRELPRPAAGEEDPESREKPAVEDQATAEGDAAYLEEGAEPGPHTSDPDGGKEHGEEGARGEVRLAGPPEGKTESHRDPQEQADAESRQEDGAPKEMKLEKDR
jgi:hypothetical protein